MGLHRCEWCDVKAVWKIADADYARYSCEIHLYKTKRTAFLDGHDVATIVYKSDGFEI